MRHCSILFLVAAALFSCKTDKPPSEELQQVADTLAAQSAADSDSVAVNPPKTADMLFDDFIYGFMKNKKFQMERIKFPLSYTLANGKLSHITEKGWKFDRLYSGQDVYTMLFSSKKEMGQEKDTTLQQATFEWIYLNKSMVKEYHFKKDDGLWKLVSLNMKKFNEHADRQFYSFYREFVRDSAYQRTHIKSPLKFRTYDYDNFQELNGVLDIDQWFAFRPNLPANKMTNIRYGKDKKETGTRILVVSSLSGGMNCILTFKYSNKKWQLVSYEN